MRQVGSLFWLLLLALVLAGACSTGSSVRAGSDDGQPEPTVTVPTREQVVAAAIQEFHNAFRANVHDASTVVVPADLDVTSLQALLGDGWTVTSDPASGSAYWEVTKALKQGGYWQVDIASVEGANFFSGSVFFVGTADGGVERVDPEEIGATPTTITS